MSKNCLYLVTTPIGNLSDLTERARDLLGECQAIIAEDTRVTKELLGLIGIKYSEKKFYSFHEHNQSEAKKILDQVRGHETVCIVSDAGSPSLSDPAFPLISQALEDGFKVTSAPGASAITTALELSGLSPIPFKFLGFLPRKSSQREKLFKSCVPEVTYIAFESPQRVDDAVDDLVSSVLESDIVIARELTKKFEEILRFTSKEWPSIKENLTKKGEFVVLWRVFGSAKKSADMEEVEKLADDYLKRPSPKSLSRLLAQIKGSSAQEIYDSLKNSSKK